ncbi:hypothetical protein [Nocardioides perillae]|uniref:Uncharacterized protein n=1 Tax=Nocardioides perillae TaxID=1119534 RepID=A0A7Y9RWA4_9ACTN|nr:hypothetical protein [Nocardioides perillae]NYG55832.1 hypothetical protein [Nocardioides perillae]
MSLSTLTALPRRLVTTAFSAATHPVATVAHGVGLARGTAAGLVHVVRGGSDASTDSTSRAPGAPEAERAGSTGTEAAVDAAVDEPTFEPVPFEPEPPAPDPEPTPEPERTAPGSVATPVPAPPPERTPEPEAEVVYSSTTPEGAEPGAGTGPGAGGDQGGVLDPATAAALQSEAETMARAADPRFGD